MSMPRERKPLVYRLDEEKSSFSESNDTSDAFADKFNVPLYESFKNDIEDALLLAKNDSNERVVSENVSSDNQVTTIRIHLQEKYVLQGFFRPSETVSAVTQFTRSCLNDDKATFYLYTAPPKMVLENPDATLVEAKLIPASIVYFSSHTKKDNWLKNELIYGIVTYKEAETAFHNVCRCNTSLERDDDENELCHVAQVQATKAKKLKKRKKKKLQRNDNNSTGGQKKKMTKRSTLLYDTAVVVTTCTKEHELDILDLIAVLDLFSLIGILNSENVAGLCAKENIGECGRLLKEPVALSSSHQATLNKTQMSRTVSASSPSTSATVTSEESEMVEIDGNLKVNLDKSVSKRSRHSVFYGKYGDRDVAVKRIPKDRYYLDKKYTQPEHQTLKELAKHENIVEYFYCKEMHGFIYFAMEICDSDLETYIDYFNKSDEVWPNFHSLLMISHQICEGVKYLHSKGFIHRDIKPANILLLDQNGWMRIKLCDVGITRKLSNDRLTYSETGHQGTLGYRPYELIAASNKDEKVTHLTYSDDIFGLGATIFFLLSKGKHPFGTKIFRDVNILKREDPELDNNILSYDQHDLIGRMLDHEASKRPSIKDVMEHPMFWKDEDRFDFIFQVSERIGKISFRDQALEDFVNDFTPLLQQNNPCRRWCDALPVCGQWGCNDQNTSAQACTGGEGQDLGLTRIFRNIWIHRVENIRNKHWLSEEEKVFRKNFPWLVTEVYKLCRTLFSVDVAIWIENYSLYISHPHVSRDLKDQGLDQSKTSNNCSDKSAEI